MLTLNVTIEIPGSIPKVLKIPSHGGLKHHRLGQLPLSDLCLEHDLCFLTNSKICLLSGQTNVCPRLSASLFALWLNSRSVCEPLTPGLTGSNLAIHAKSQIPRRVAFEKQYMHILLQRHRRSTTSLPASRDGRSHGSAAFPYTPQSDA